MMVRYGTFSLAAVSLQLIAILPSTAATQEVSGIYTDATTKDLGAITNIELFKGIKFRGWVEGYYEQNFNRPSHLVVDENQSLSGVKAPALTIEGRTFDVHRNTISLSLAEIEVEKVPERGGVGFKLDMAGGNVQEILVNTINGASPNSVSDFDKVFQHASLSYLAPVGNGLRLDFGKFVTHIGGETIESIKNRNFSHTYYYTYGIPFSDVGLRANYAVNSEIYGEVYVLNGWNVTTDNNNAKTVGLSIGWTPRSNFSLYANYLGGPERNDNDRDWRHLGDFQVVFSPIPLLQTMLNVDVGTDRNAIAPGRNGNWSGATLYARMNINGHFFPTGRIEYYSDPQGFTTAVAQHVWGYTFTGDYKLGRRNDFAHLMLRPEIRYDQSNALFFSSRDRFRSEKQQLTAGLGLVAYF
jgi:hypothetical protein